MRWFDGGIAQAVAKSKVQNAVFVVFVQGQDDSSQRLSALINSKEVSSKLEGENFVAVSVQTGTETFNHFSQIYRSPAIPSLYFIGRNGVPIEIVSEVSDASSLLEKISSVEGTHFGKEQVVSKSVSGAESSVPSSSSQPSSSVANNAPPSSTAASSPSTANKEDPNIEAPSSSSLEERVDRAKELLQEKRVQKQIEEDRELREKELKRRQEGKNLQELRRWQQEEDLKKVQEERRRERRLEQEARQKVLEQIAQDRANRNAKFAATPPAPIQPQAASTPVVSNSNVARIQFRLPDGTSVTHSFGADATLGEVRQYLVANVNLPFRDFSLVTMFPRREFSTADNDATLRDLQLVPSSVLLILATTGRAVVHQGGSGMLGMLQLAFVTLTYPIVSIFNYLRSFIFGTGVNQQSGTSSQGNTSSQTQQTSSEKRTQRRNGGNGGTYRRAGNSNVHRLHQNNSSDDDENNTWNGNSTQQM